MLGDKLPEGMKEVFAKTKPGIVHMAGYGSTVGIGFLGEDADKLWRLFYFYLLGKGIYIGARGSMSLSIVYEEEHVERSL